MGDFQNRNLGPYLSNLLNPIYFFPAEEQILQNSPDESDSKVFDKSGLINEQDLLTSYSDYEEYYHAPVPEHLVLADFVS